MLERDATATKARIMAAATTEFAAHGLAGGRVDRIARDAGVNKSLIYHHFGNKETLFDLVFDAHVERNVVMVPLDASHLPEWAVAIYDYYLSDPTLVQLATWARLERTPTGDLFVRSGGLDPMVIERIADAQRAGVLIDSTTPLDMFCLTVAMAGTWAQASVTVAGSPDDDPAEHERRRLALAGAVRRAFCRAGDAPGTSVAGGR